MSIKDYVYLGALAVLATVFFWYRAHVENLGVQKCETADTKVVVQQEVHNATVAAQDTAEITQETKTHAEVVTAPVAHPVQLRVCPDPAPRGPLSNPATAGPGGNGVASLPGSGHGDPVPTQSDGPKLQAVGRDADAQIVELQSYIRNVCLKR